MPNPMRYNACLLLYLTLVVIAGCAAGPGRGFVFTDCDVCPELVIVPGGKFSMGAPGGEPDRPEGPVREISIKSFSIGRYEITNAEYRTFLEASRYTPDPGCLVWRDGFVDVPEAGWAQPEPGLAPASNEPVVCVSWNDANAYARWLSALTGRRYRLPTEAEWEYVASSGQPGTYPWGDDSARACEFANVLDATGQSAGQFDWPAAECDDGYARVAPVGRFQANRFGLFDVIGNVWEWTEDCYEAPYPPGPLDGGPVRGGEQCELRTVRGGGWITRPDRLRPTFRGRDPAGTRYRFFGFRVVRELY